jgi:hypothetical protein
MKRSVLPAFLFMGLCTVNAAFPDNRNFISNRSAYGIDKGKCEFGLFQPLRYGVSRKVELSAHPVLFFLDPHLSAKIQWSEPCGFLISSEHGVAVPTPLLRFFQMKGAGGMISRQFTIPVMASVFNGVLVSKPLSGKSCATVKAAVLLAVNTKRLDKLSTIDLPVIYPRLAVFYRQPVINAALDIRHEFSRPLGVLAATEYFVVPGARNNFFFEHRLNLLWRPWNPVMVQAGYLLCYGRYPFGAQWHLLPAVDFVFHSGGKKK